jgi:large subunit ribosomal protein L4
MSKEVKKTTTAKKTATAKVVKTVKTVKKAETPKVAVKKVGKKTTEKVATTIDVSPVKIVTGKDVTVNVVNPQGVKTGTVDLPAELFAGKINSKLVAQSVRVYLANQREGGAMTKTRGEVEGSTKKIYKQKGTGRARHGGIRAPIFVGGGIAFGPRTHEFTLKLPQKMKRLALASCLTDKLKDGNVIVVDGMNTLEAKTKVMSASLAKIAGNKKVLFLTGNESHKTSLSIRNISFVDIMPIKDLYAYAVLTHRKLVINKDALNELTQTK